MAFKQDRNDELMDALRAEVQFRYEPNFAHKSVTSLFLALPGLVAFWPMSSLDRVSPINQVIDLGGAGQNLTNQNTSLFGYDNLAPYAEFNGVNQYLRKLDGGIANWADITGTEAYIEPTQRGLTLGGWFNPAAIGDDALIGKFNTNGNQRSYLLRLQTPADVAQFDISTDGTAVVTLQSTSLVVVDTWQFIGGRFTPSTESAMFLNSEKTTNVAGIPASIFDSTADFLIGAWQGAGGAPSSFLEGRSSMCFLCAAALSDAIVGQVYQQSRAMFGV